MIHDIQASVHTCLKELSPDQTAAADTVQTKLQKAYYARINALKEKGIICPACQEKGSMEECSTYERYFLHFVADTVLNLYITITVFYCEHCGTYHALLPAYLRPYHGYTYSFMYAVRDFFSQGLYPGIFTKASSIFLISSPTVHSILDDFEDGSFRSFSNNIDAADCPSKFSGDTFSDFLSWSNEKEDHPAKSGSSFEVCAVHDDQPDLQAIQPEKQRAEEFEGKTEENSDSVQKSEAASEHTKARFEQYASAYAKRNRIPLFCDFLIHFDHSPDYILDIFKKRPGKPHGGNYYMAFS